MTQEPEAKAKGITFDGLDVYWSDGGRVIAREIAQGEKLSFSKEGNRYIAQLQTTETKAIRAAAHEEAAQWHEREADAIQSSNSKITSFAMQYDNVKSNPMDTHHRACAAAIRTLSTKPPEYVVVKRDDIRAIERLLLEASQVKGDAILTKDTP
jgi:hypothetical protein